MILVPLRWKKPLLRTLLSLVDPLMILDSNPHQVHQQHRAVQRAGAEDSELAVHLRLPQLRHGPDRVRILQPQEEQDQEMSTGENL